jgi:hypothetical protein
MVLKILVIQHSGTIDFTDGGFHFSGGRAKIARDIRFFPNAHQELRRAEIAASVQISGVASWRIGSGRGWPKKGDRRERA